MMERRTAMVVTVTYLLFSFVIIQLADPQFGQRTPPEVDFSESPSEIAADAATKFEYVDYGYQTDILHSGQKTWSRVGNVQVKNSNREYMSFGPRGLNGSRIYGNDAVVYAKASPQSSWTIETDPGAVYPAVGFTQPFQTRKIDTSKSRVLKDNQSVLVIWINASVQTISTNFPGETTLYIDKNTGIITKGITKYENDNGKKSILRFKLTTRDPTIHRPRVSIWEYPFDVLRGPIAKIF